MARPYSFRFLSANRRFGASVCATSIAATLTLLQPTAAGAQILTLGGVVDDLRALGTRVDAQGGAILANTSAIATLDNNAIALTARVNVHATALQNAQSTLATNVIDVANLTTRSNQQDARLAANIDAVTMQANALGTLSGRVAANATTLQTVQAAIGVNVADLAAVTATLGQQSTRIAANVDAVGSLNDTVVSQARTVQVLGGAVDRVQGDIGVLAGTVDGLAASTAGNTRDLGSLSAAVGTNVSDIAGLRVALGTQGADISRLGLQAADQDVRLSALTSTVTAQGGRLVRQGADLETAAANIASLQGLVRGQAGTLGSLGSTVEAQAALLGRQGVQIAANADAILSLRNMAVSGNASPVQFTTPQAPLVAVATATNDVAILGALPEPVRLHNVAAGRLETGSTDAINGEQLHDTNVALTALTGTVNGHNTDIATLRTSVGNLGTSIDAQTTLLTREGSRISANIDALRILRQEAENGALGPVRYSTPTLPTTPNGGTVTDDITLVGTGAAPVRLHNVAAGTIGAGSTDAVNGGQLFALSQSYDGLRDLAVQYDSPGHNAVSLGGSGAPVLLRNVMAGTVAAGSTEAANGGQLFTLGRGVVGILGNGATYDASTGFDARFSFGGRDYGDIQSVFGAIEGSLATGPGQQPVPGTAYPATQAKYFHANSTMEDSQATGFDATAIGPASRSTGEAAIAVGRNTVAAGISSVAIGDGATARDGKAVSIGLGNVASGDGAVAIGDPNLATGEGAVALGKDNTATGMGAIALGNVNQVVGDGATAIGSLNQSNGRGASTLGYTNVAEGLGAIAIGSNNRVVGDGSLAIGSNVDISARDTLAIGAGTTTSGTSAAALGNRARAAGNSASALGNDAIASSGFATAVGSLVTASGYGSTSLGVLANATAFVSTALGSGTIADKEASVALGAAAHTLRGAVGGYAAFGLSGTQQSFGEIAIARTLVFTDPVTGATLPTGGRQITGVAAGWEDGDAVNVAQLRGVSGTLGAAFVRSLGSGAAYDPVSGTLTGPTYRLNGVAYANVGDALQALAAQPTGTGTGGQSTGGQPVNYDTSSGKDITLADGGTTIRNVAPGVIAPGSTQAVNGGQLAQTNADVTRLADSVANGTVGAIRYADPGSSTPNAGVRTNDAVLVGADPAAAVALHNVAEGKVAPGSTDAINGSQLAATNGRVASLDTRVTSVEDKADRALATSSRSVQYDAGGEAVTLGGGGAAVALRNVADGRAGTDAVNLGQLDRSMAGVAADARAYTDGRVAALSFDLAKVNRDANAGVAGAMALAGMPQAFEEGKSMASMGMGTFQGQTAVAIGLSRVMNDGRTVMKLGATRNSRKEVGANLGLGYQF